MLSLVPAPIPDDDVGLTPDELLQAMLRAMRPRIKSEAPPKPVLHIVEQPDAEPAQLLTEEQAPDAPVVRKARIDDFRQRMPDEGTDQL